jgi:hypothetical protein
MQQVATEVQEHGFISQETVVFMYQASHIKYWTRMLVDTLVAALHVRNSGGCHDRLREISVSFGTLVGRDVNTKFRQDLSVR